MCFTQYLLILLCCDTLVIFIPYYRITQCYYQLIYTRVCVKMTTPLKMIPWHHISSNIINATQQYYKCYTTIYRLFYRVLDIAGREKIGVYSVVYCWPRFLHLSIFFYCHMTTYYLSTCTNDWLEMVVWCHFNAPIYTSTIYTKTYTRMY